MAASTSTTGNTQQSPPSAAARVFGTVELCEKILLKLDMASILRAQQVSTKCRDTIVGSKKLQEALFYRKVPGDGTHLGTNGVNTLAFSNNNSAQGRQLRYETLGLDCTIICSPVGPHGGANEYYINTCINSKEWKQPDKVRPSWYNMYPVQPPALIQSDPCFELLNIRGNRYDDKDAAYNYYVLVGDVEDMTLGEICEAVLVEVGKTILEAQLNKDA